MLKTEELDTIVHKGTLDDQDAYSAFGCGKEITKLGAVLKENGIQKVFIVGLAFDFCVGSTAIDSAKNGFDTYILMDYTKSVADGFEKVMKDRIQALPAIQLINGNQPQVLKQLQKILQ